MANVYIVVKHDSLADKIIRVFEDRVSAESYSALCNDTAITNQNEFYIVERHLLMPVKTKG